MNEVFICLRKTDHDWDNEQSECCGAAVREDGVCACCLDHPGDPIVECIHCGAEAHISEVRYPPA